MKTDLLALGGLTLLALTLAACAGTAPPTASPTVASDPAGWPGPVHAETALRFGDGGNASASDAEVRDDGRTLVIRVATPGEPAAWGASTDITLPDIALQDSAQVTLGPDQFLAFELSIEGAQDAPLWIQLDEPRGDTNLRGILVVDPPPARGAWQRLTLELLRNELSGDRRPRTAIIPDGTRLTRLGIRLDPRARAGLTHVALRNVRVFRQDPLAHAPIDGVDAHGQTALHRAAMRGDAERVRELLARGADVNAISEYRFTPLAHAVIAHDAATVAALIEHGADVAAQRRLGFTPLYDAAADGQLEIARLLLAAGADPTQRTEYGFEPLFTAVHHGHVEVCELLLADPRVDVNRPIAGFVPLHVAAQGDAGGPHRALYERLIELGATVDLCSAAAAGDDARIGAMLATDPEAARTTTILGGWTPLHDAVRNAHRSTVELLLAHGADPNAISGDIDSKSAPLHWLGHANERDATADKLAILDRLLAAGANVDILDKDGRTPLDRARQTEPRALVDALVAAGARSGSAVRDGQRAPGNR